MMTDRIGQQLGNYQLIRLLGEGGFAEVYLGEHIHLGTQAAIKLLHTQLISDDVDKFRTEARTIARLLHPNIVRVLEFGIEGKTPYLVMDYAPKGTLRQLHPKGQILPLPTVISYVKQIAEALQCAHDEKLIHRDVKPENMLVGRRGEILLSDFGIALVAQSSRYQSTQDMTGTIAYMAPEQIQGKPRPASDQYSLGITVYEWLTGDRPFHGGFIEIVAQHITAPVPSLRDKAPTLPADVEHVVMTALEKDHTRRFGSMLAFAKALEQAAQSQDVQPSVKSPARTIEPTVEAKPIMPPKAPTPQEKSPVTPPKPVGMVHEAKPITPAQTPTPQEKPPITPASPLAKPVMQTKPIGTVIYTYRGHSQRVNVIVWLPDGRYSSSGSDDGTIQVWSLSTGKVSHTFRCRFGAVRAIAAWSADGTYLATGGGDNVYLWNAVTGEHMGTYLGHSGYVNAIACSQRFIATASDDSTIRVWDPFTARLITIYRGHSGSADTIAWSPDAYYVVSGGFDTIVHVWDANTGRDIHRYQGHTNNVRTVAWSPDGKHIASGDADGKVQVWNTTTKSKIFSYSHSARVNAMSWAQEGKRLASASSDKTVQVWDITANSKLFTFKHEGPVHAMAWSPDGKYIASGGDDKIVHVWVAP